MKLAVIGGGASGMISAIFAARNGAQVTLFEKNEKLGKKIYITGKGRCNLTNFCPVPEFVKNIVSQPKFMYSSLNALSPYDCYSFFEEIGLSLKVERGNRVFPSSDKASDVIKVLEQELKKQNVKILLNKPVQAINQYEDKFEIIAGGKYIFDKVIVATGGMTYKSTGSTGDGYKFLRKFGHKVTPLVGGLFAFDMFENFYSEIAGLTLKNINLSCFHNDKLVKEEFGELLFTHTGISGPTVLTISSFVNRFKADELSFKIDFKPALSEEVLEARLMREFNSGLNKFLKSIMETLLPKSLIPIVLNFAKISGDKIVNSITQTERKRLVFCLKNFEMRVKNFADINTAIITAGGVATSEIDPKTMESKIVKGLYVCGEIIDVDALTGGFNLQIAFSTGFAAGNNASKT